MAEQESKSQTKFTDFDESVSHGAMYDKLNLKRITYWSIMGIVTVVIIVLGVMELYHFNKFQFQQSASMGSEFIETQRLRANEQAHLNTHGVLDAEAGIYHIPVDSAITLILLENE